MRKFRISINKQGLSPIQAGLADRVFTALLPTLSVSSECSISNSSLTTAIDAVVPTIKGYEWTNERITRVLDDSKVVYTRGFRDGAVFLNITMPLLSHSGGISNHGTKKIKK